MDQRADQRVVQIGGRGRRPEQQRREQQPQANPGAGPARDREAPGQRYKCQNHDCQPREHIAPDQRLRLVAEGGRRGDQPGAEADVEKVRPEIAPVLGAIARLVPGPQSLGVLDLFGRGLEPGRRRDAIVAIPRDRIVLQRLDDLGQGRADPAPRLPAEQVPRPGDVEGVVIVGHVDHERPDERLLALIDRIRHDRLRQLLKPGAGPRQCLRHGDRGPFVLAVHQAADRLLERAVADRVRLANQDRDVVRQALAPIDHPAEAIDHVVPVDEGLAGAEIAGIEMALDVALVDPRDLLREGRHGGAVVVQTREVEQDVPDRAMLLPDHRLGRRLGLGIGPFRRDRRLLVDPLAGFARRVHQHRSRVDELADLERLKRAQQAACALHVDLVVERMVLAGEVEIGGKMHDARDARAMLLTEFPKRQLDRIRGGQIDLDAVDRRFATLQIEADHAVVGLERLGEGRADRAGDAGDHDDRLGLRIGIHVDRAGVPRAGRRQAKRARRGASSPRGLRAIGRPRAGSRRRDVRSWRIVARAAPAGPGRRERRWMPNP
jgi:hypothetical protein